MRLPVILLALALLLYLAVDAYIYFVACRRSHNRLFARIHLFSAAALYLLLAVALCLPMRTGQSSVLLAKMWLLFGFFTVVIGKFIFVLADIVAYLPRIFKKTRWRRFTPAGAILGAFVFASLWWGALVNRYNIDTVEIDIHISDLPDAFDGYRIVQISDLHVGTYGGDPAFVARLVGHVNSLHPDLILFTGDVVNRRTDEILPFVDALSKLSAPDGVYSILGNHDYGDYYDWNSDVEKKASLDSLIFLQRKMGWRLLLNEYDFIRHGVDSIALIGVENVGDPPFKVYGDLKVSYPDLSDGITKILLTHNPAHWDMEIADNNKANVALTLSGHTHAMQIRVLGLSPAAWRYRHWGGLYRDGSGRHQLYVNIGVGTVGMPMRLGATPEVTVFTLKK